MRRRNTLSKLAVLPGLLLAAGCASSPKIVIHTHPQWSFEQYATIAVMPFASRTPDLPDVGARISGALEQALIENVAATSRIVRWETVAERIEAPDLIELPGRIERGEPLPQGLPAITTALITGVCTQFETTGDVQKRWVAQPSHSANPNGDSAVAGERLVERDRYVHAATVAAELRVIDTLTGQTLHRHATGSVTVRRARWGTPPAQRPDELAAQAAEVVTRRLMREVAVMRSRVKVRSKSLIIASQARDGRWIEERKFTADTPTLSVVVRDLPPALDGTEARIEITKKGERTPVVSEDFQWSSTYGSSGQRFALSPARMVEHSGVGKFRAALSIGDEVVVERDFRIRPRRQDEAD